MMSVDHKAQLKDPFIYPIKMKNEIMAKLPLTFVLTSEFDFYRRDANSFAKRLFENNRLIDICVLPGLNQSGPILLASESELQ
jgi:acetyl esterase/lipase